MSWYLWQVSNWCTARELGRTQRRKQKVNSLTRVELVPATHSGGVRAMTCNVLQLSAQQRGLARMLHA